MARIVKVLWDFYNSALISYPVLTQGCTASSLFGAGDIICQTIERYQYRSKMIEESDEKKEKGEKLKDFKYDWTRVGRMATVGFVVVGPACHFWYKFLDSRMPSTKTVQVIQKILVDEFLFGPIYLGTFFVSISTLEGMTPQQTAQKIKKDFLPTFKMDMTVWPPAQAINFFFLPPSYRVLYISFISLFWNAYLSMVQHND